MYVLVKNNQIVRYPYSVTDLIRANPQTSFPKGKLPDDLLEEYGVMLAHGEVPPCSTGYAVDEGMPAFDGVKWNRQFVIRPCNQAEIDVQSTQVREIREKKLAESDWTQVADAPVDKAAWATYRQALRDITSQSGFPWSVVWPIEP